MFTTYQDARRGRVRLVDETNILQVSPVKIIPVKTKYRENSYTKAHSPKLAQFFILIFLHLEKCMFHSGTEAAKAARQVYINVQRMTIHKRGEQLQVL